MKQYSVLIVSFWALICPLALKAKTWHVAVSGHGYTYNTSSVYPASCNTFPLLGPGSGNYPIDQPLVTTASNVTIPGDLFNRLKISATAAISVYYTRFPCGDWDAANSCWQQGDGSEQYPWSLEFALSNPPDPAFVYDGSDPNYPLNYNQLEEFLQDPSTYKWSYTIPRWIQPGDIILVHGGIYNGRRILVPQNTWYDYANPHYASHSTVPDNLFAPHSAILHVGTLAGSCICNMNTVSIEAGSDYTTLLKTFNQKLFLHTSDATGDYVYLVTAKRSSCYSPTAIDFDVEGYNYIERPGVINTINGPLPNTTQTADLFTADGQAPFLYSGMPVSVYSQTNYKCYLNGQQGYIDKSIPYEPKPIKRLIHI